MSGAIPPHTICNIGIHIHNVNFTQPESELFFENYSILEGCDAE
jgi:hypothetical protein